MRFWLIFAYIYMHARNARSNYATKVAPNVALYWIINCETENTKKQHSLLSKPNVGWTVCLLFADDIAAEWIICKKG